MDILYIIISKMKHLGSQLNEMQSKLIEYQSLLEKANTEIQALKAQAQLNLASFPKKSP
jgi:hypothetical protein